MKPTLISKRIATDIFLNDDHESIGYLKSAAVLHKKVIIPTYDDKLEDFLNEVIYEGLTPNKQRIANETFTTIGKWDSTLQSFWMKDFLDTMDALGEKGDKINKNELTALTDEILSSVPKFSLNIHHEMISLYYSLKLQSSLHAKNDELANLSRIFETSTSIGNSNELIELMIPELEDLEWKDIFELRQNPYLDRFRLFLTEMQNSSLNNQEILNHMSNEIWRAIGYSKPSKFGSMIKRIVANIPVSIPLNPYSVIKDLGEAKKESDTFFEYGWVWFIQEIKSKN